MEQIQQRALNSLEPFVALSKSATSPRAASDLINQATSASNTYIFAELLQTPNIQALRYSEYASHLHILEIFAWGTYQDYLNHSLQLPKLSQPQELKLRLLTLLPILTSTSSPSADNLSYFHLQSQLSLPDTQALESLITTALANGLITGHLDPLHQRIAVTSVAPLRDLAPMSVPAMIANLAAWEERCNSTLADIQHRVATIRDEARERQHIERRREKAFEAKCKTAENDENSRAGYKGGKRAAPTGYNGSARGDEMEVDDPEGPSGGGGGGGGAKRGKKMLQRLTNMR